MKHIAIISPGILPVPAVRGGAVESLITFLIEENEKTKGIAFDVFTVDDPGINGKNYRNTTIYPVKESKLVHLGDRVLDKIYRSLPGEISARRIFDQTILKKLKRVLSKAEYKYDAIIVQNQTSLAVRLLKAGIAGNCPIFFHIHNDIDIYRSPHDCGWLADRNVRFLCVSQYIKNRILTFAPKADARVVYNGTDTDLFNRKHIEKRDLIRQEFGIHSDETVFLYSGRIIRQKGVRELMEGYHAFQNEHPDRSNRLLIVGMSDAPSKYEEQIVEMRSTLGEKVLLAKKVDALKMAEIVAAMDVVVIPTLDEEPFGMVAIEAMAMGKPIVATSSGALTELLSTDNAIMISKGDHMTKDLAGAFEKLKDADLRKRMGENSQRRFEENEEWHKSAFYKNFCSALGIT